MSKGLNGLISTITIFQRVSRASEMKQRDAQRVGNNIMYFASDASAFISCGVRRQLAMQLSLLNEQCLLSAH
ncbi:hypothetical protein A9W96_27375 [Mycobacterium sp. 1245852.3]|nr:hypothetical protein A9W96_27375 [Mycobacterium sp. 1245852.3]